MMELSAWFGTSWLIAVLWSCWFGPAGSVVMASASLLRSPHSPRDPSILRPEEKKLFPAPDTVSSITSTVLQHLEPHEDEVPLESLPLPAPAPRLPCTPLPLKSKSHAPRCQLLESCQALLAGCVTALTARSPGLYIAV